MPNTELELGQPESLRETVDPTQVTYRTLNRHNLTPKGRPHLKLRCIRGKMEAGMCAEHRARTWAARITLKRETADPT